MEKLSGLNNPKKGVKKMFSKMALQFTPIGFGIMLVVAVGTLAYTVWNINSNNRQSHSYGNSNKDNDYGYGCGNDIYRWDDPPVERKRKKKGTDKCTICLDVMKDNVRTLSCKHIFHNHCITMWFNTNKTCPICRTSSS